MRTRLSGFHTTNKKPIPGERVLFSGYLQVYDSEKRRWEPIRGKLMLFIDGMKMREFSSNTYGEFEVEYVFHNPRSYDVEVRFEGGAKVKASSSALKVEVVTEEERRKTLLLIRISTILILAFVILVSAILLLSGLFK
jgi:hypothetical protein